MPGAPLHVTHRGNRKGPVFFDDWDRLAYLETLSEYSARFGLDVWGYCLMNNHVHLLVCPRQRKSLARAIGNAHRQHAERINRRHGWCGHLWQARYFSTLLDERHLWCAVRYIELNPVRAGLARRAEEYRWSSARAHCAGEGDFELSPSRPFPGVVGNWSDWLSGVTDSAAEAVLRANSRSGRPTGSREFVAQVEATLGRCLTPARPGRPLRNELGTG